MTFPRTLMFLIACALFASESSIAQPWSIGINAGAFQWMPWSSFRDVSGIPGPQLISFQGNRPTRNLTVSLGAEYRYDSLWSIGASMAYMPTSLSYSAAERAPIALPGGGLYTATLRHDIQADITSVAFTPHVRYKIGPLLSLQMGLPLHVLTRARYTQVMRFTDPVGLTFVDGNIEQITGQGAIANKRLIVPALSLSAQAELPLNAQRTIMVVPRIGVHTALSTVTKDGAYTLRGIEASIGVRYTLGETPEQAPPAVPTPRDTTPVAAPAPVATMETRVERDTVVELQTGISATATTLERVEIDTVYGTTSYRRMRELYKTIIPKPPSVLRGSLVMQFIDEDGSASSNARLTATRVVSRRSVPVVPFVVFDEDSTGIPSRYVQLSEKEGKTWTERSVLSDERHWHYEVLNVIGSRMRTLRTATCQLQMYVSAADTIRGNAVLRSVRTYLMQRFGITEDRIEVVPSGKGLVDRGIPTFGNTVVVSDPTGGLLQPIEGTVNFVEARLPTVRITPDAISEAGLSNWDVVIRQEQQERYRIHDSTGVLHDVTVDLNDVMSADVAMKSPLAFTLLLQDVEHTSMVSEPIMLKLTSKALRQSERATPLKRTESLRMLRGTSFQQQTTQHAGQKVIDNPPWAVKGLAEPELGLYEQGTRVVIHEERRP